MTNHYELLYIVSGNYTEDELLPIKEKIRELIEKADGKITLEDNLGKKKLTYPIKKTTQGYYLLYEFDLETVALKKLNHVLLLTGEIIRHLITKKSLTAPSMVEITQEQVATEKIKKQEEKVEKKDKIKLEDLDKKLDEILDSDVGL